MKHLVALISTEEKPPEQISSEAKKAFEKYQKVSKKVNKEIKRASLLEKNIVENK